MRRVRTGAQEREAVEEEGGECVDIHSEQTIRTTREAMEDGAASEYGTSCGGAGPRNQKKEDKTRL